MIVLPPLLFSTPHFPLKLMLSLFSPAGGVHKGNNTSAIGNQKRGAIKKKINNVCVTTCRKSHPIIRRDQI